MSSICCFVSGTTSFSTSPISSTVDSALLLFGFGSPLWSRASVTRTPPPFMFTTIGADTTGSGDVEEVISFEPDDPVECCTSSGTGLLLLCPSPPYVAIDET
uniref:Uncharacterized protein n=1 Tax=Anopheles farauti TaxID=69004 RepID=A0A182QHN6_9DIPT